MENGENQGLFEKDGEKTHAAFFHLILGFAFSLQL